MAAKPTDPAPSGSTGGTATGAAQATPVLGEIVTEGAVTPRGTITSHTGAPEPGNAPGGIVRRDAPPATAPLADPTFTVKNMLQQPLHHASGTVPKGGTFQATAKEILAYGKQVERVG